MMQESINEKKIKHNDFRWANLGDIKEGRGVLGEEMPVLVYRLMQYTLLDILSKSHGYDLANEYFKQAGVLAGRELAINIMDLGVDFDTFIFSLKELLEELKIGIMRAEAYDPETGSIVLTVGQDLDCSGLINTNETVCIYDEGFISGILEAYTGHKYNVREVDCWANGDKLCRFNATVEPDAYQ